jgi:hypothetical protein
MLTPFTAKGGTSGLPRSNMPVERTARPRHRWRVPSRLRRSAELNGGVRGHGTVSAEQPGAADGPLRGPPLNPSVRPRTETDGSS